MKTREDNLADLTFAKTSGLLLRTGETKGHFGPSSPFVRLKNPNQKHQSRFLTFLLFHTSGKSGHIRSYCYSVIYQPNIATMMSSLSE